MKRYHFDLGKASFVMALPFAIAKTQAKSRLYPLAVNTSQWPMPSALEKVDKTCIRYELRNSFAISVTHICDDVELENYLHLIYEEIFAPKSATNWWRNTTKPIYLVL